MRKKLPIGVDGFEKLRNNDFYYVDKTGFIEELLQNWGEVNLFTRPRRFGKSLNMSMLKSFFEIGADSHLFEGLRITQNKKLCETYLGQFPVISLTLKGVEGLTFESARDALRNLIGMEAMRFQFLMDSDALSEGERDMYKRIVNIRQTGGMFEMTSDILESSLKTLSMLLCKHYGKKVILLIDEYDVPLDKASQNGYYEQMVDLIRKLFSNALKTNENLQFAVMTGCLRVSKESIFTGLNNLNIMSVTNAKYNEYFGFTDREVREMLAYYEISDMYASVKEWYDGYLFGKINVYCPWDVISYCDELRAVRRSDPDAKITPKNYWVNTSGNVIIKTLLTKATGQTKAELERLIAGETLEKKIEENLTYNELYDSVDNIWSVLFATGYLTCDEITEHGVYRLHIPNMEIRSIFVNQIMKWFEEQVRTEPTKLDFLCDAVLKGDAVGFQEGLNGFLKKTISIRDTAVKSKKENFYHGILLGILSYRETWYIRSNVESGDGYSDILLADEETETGIVIELKYAQDGNLENACEKALKQIMQKSYASKLEDDGMTTIIRYGIAFYKKRCRIFRG